MVIKHLRVICPAIPRSRIGPIGVPKYFAEYHQKQPDFSSSRKDEITRLTDLIARTKEDLRSAQSNMEANESSLSQQTREAQLKAISEIRGLIVSLELSRNDEIKAEHRRIEEEQKRREDAEAIARRRLEEEERKVRTGPAGAVKSSGLQVVPDSARLVELLPIELRAQFNKDLFFVNRDVSMETLMDAHFEMYLRRVGGVSGGPAIVVPLLDSQLGMGKSTFASKYLALVERNSVSGTLSGRWMIEDYSPFRDELKRARSLHICLRIGQLLDSESRLREFNKQLIISLKELWGISIPETPDLTAKDIIYQTCSSEFPMFLILDEIGLAFTGKLDHGSIETSREEFFHFVLQICVPMTWIPGFYLLLSGRADFLDYIGHRPGGLSYPATEKSTIYTVTSPVQFRRVDLNPIRPKYLQQIVERTTYVPTQGDLANGSIANALIASGKSVDAFCEHLYRSTGGHAREVKHALKWYPKLYQPDPNNPLLAALRRYLKLYPLSSKKLFDAARDKTPIDLSQPIEGVTLQYVASRLQVGYDFDITRTIVHIPPSIESLLAHFFMPFPVRVRKYRNIDSCDSKGRMFELILVSWFQSVFSSTRWTCGEAAQGFIPRNASFYGSRWAFSNEKLLFGHKIVTGKRRTQEEHDTGISVEDLGRLLSEHLTSRSHDIYLPAHSSASPDFLLIPEGPENQIIGVAAKCYGARSTLKNPDIIAEVEKFKKILNHIGVPDLKPALIICATTVVSDGERAARSKRREGVRCTSKGYLWKHPSNLHDFEVIVFNLSSPEFRNDFFSLALASDAGADNDTRQMIQTIEDLIARPS